MTEQRISDGVVDYGFGILNLASMVRERMAELGESQEQAVNWISGYAELRSEAISQLRKALEEL